MPFNVLLLPLLGGYIFISYWNVTRFDARRYRGERLIFHAAIAGVAFLLIAFVITRGLVVWQPTLHTRWRDLVPFEYTGTSLLAFAMGATLWLPLNALFHDKAENAQQAVESWGDFLELLLNRAMNETQHVAITLSSNKVYIGLVTSNFDPAFDRKYMLLMPMASGYRDEQTKELIITHDYARVYRQLIDDDSPYVLDSELADEFQLVLPISGIVSANLFDSDVYDLFESANEPEAQNKVTATTEHPVP